MALARLVTGDVFAGDFRVLRPLSEGGMGAVYEVEQVSTGNRRALKLMHRELVSDAKLRARFVQEARVGARIASDHVVQVVAAGVDDASGTPWLAMELLEGEDLGRLVAHRGVLPRADVREIFAQLAHALSAAHAVGVVHRDLKPENVFVASARRVGARRVVKVLDFGIAKIVADAQSGTAAMGTLLWMAPEQTEERATIDPSADVWAFGLLAYWALTGSSFWRTARDGEGSSARLMREILFEPIPSASARAAESGASVPKGFDAWFERAVVRDRGQRFASLDAAWSALVGVLSSEEQSRAIATAPTELAAPTPVHAASTAAGNRLRRPAAMGLAVAALLVGVVAAIAMLSARHGSPTPRGPSSSALAASASSSGASVLPALADAGGDAPAEDENDLDSTIAYAIPTGDAPRRGGAQPLVTIIEFNDFECPYGALVEETMTKLRAHYGDDLALVWRDYLLDVHVHAPPAARLAREARAELGDEGFWKLRDRLTSMCSGLTLDHLRAVGRDLGLDPAKVDAALGGAWEAEVDADSNFGDDWGVKGTPSFFINGRRLAGARPYEEFAAMIDEEIAKAKASIASGVDRKDVYAALVEHGAPPPPPPTRKLPHVTLMRPMKSGEHPAITLTEFGDHTDPFSCAVEPTLKQVLAKYGEVLIYEWRDFPSAESTDARRAAMAGREAFHQQGHDGFWKMHARIEQNVDTFGILPMKPGGLKLPALIGFAREQGLNVPLFEMQVTHEAGASEIDADIAAAKTIGVGRTPAFLLGNSTDNESYYIEGLVPFRQFARLIERKLAQTKK